MLSKTQTVTVLVRALCGIMLSLSYHNLVQWHRQRWEESEDSLAIWYTRNIEQAGGRMFSPR